MTTGTPPGLSSSADELQQEAHAWVRKLYSGEATERDAQMFRRWRDASPAHQMAFINARNEWRLLRPALDTLLSTDHDAEQLHAETLRGTRLYSRRAFLGAAVSAAAVGVVAVQSPFGLWPAAGDWNVDYRTATGEQRSLVLASRVSVILNTRTSIRQISSAGETVGMDLLSGEAAVEVPSSIPAFRLVAGKGQTVASSAQFEVRHTDNHVRVSCLSGQIGIEHPAGSYLLHAKQQLVYTDQTVSGIAFIDPGAISGWRHGELVFRQTPLSAVISEINRYRPGRIVLMNDTVSRRTLSARFKLDRLDLALLQIQHSFDLTERSFPAGIVVLS